MSKKPVLAAAVAVVVIILAVIYTAYHSNGPGPSNILRPSSPPTNSNLSFTGESALTNIGVTSDQVTNLQQTLQQYLTSVNKSPRTINFSSVFQTGQNVNAATPIWTVSFVIKLDNKTAYQARMDYFNLSGIRLYLYDPGNNALVYDSQDVGASPNGL